MFALKRVTVTFRGGCHPAACSPETEVPGQPLAFLDGALRVTIKESVANGIYRFFHWN